MGARTNTRDTEVNLNILRYVRHELSISYEKALSFCWVIHQAIFKKLFPIFNKCGFCILY